MVNSKGLLLMKICKRKLICFKLCFKVCGWMAGRETYVGVVNVTKMLDEVTVSFCPLKLRALSLASVPFHALPSSTHFSVPRNTRVCFYCATRTIEKNLIRCTNATRRSEASVLFHSLSLVLRVILACPRVHLLSCFPVEGHP